MLYDNLFFIQSFSVRGKPSPTTPSIEKAAKSKALGDELYHVSLGLRKRS